MVIYQLRCVQARCEIVRLVHKKQRPRCAVLGRHYQPLPAASNCGVLTSIGDSYYATGSPHK